jgi:hypothetical protein
MKFKSIFMKHLGLWRLSVAVALMTCAVWSQVALAQTMAATHCSQEEKIVFSCPFKNKKTVSLCASANLTKDKGILQYRYGVVGKKPELEFPNEAQMLKARTGHPIRFYSYFASTVPGKGDSADISFKLNDHNSTPFSYNLSTDNGTLTYRLFVNEYQYPADRHPNQISKTHVCIKNKVTNNLSTLQNIGISSSNFEEF